MRVGGVDVRGYDLEALRDQVAVVLQKNVLFSGSIRENLRWGNKDATDAEMEEACRLAQADEFIRQFPDGYDTHIEPVSYTHLDVYKRQLRKEPLMLLWGDLHNHCGITYGFGSLQNALKIARSHLDFCCITGHAMWPDIYARTPETEFIVDFHREGFKKLLDHWDEIRAEMARQNDGGLVTFQS